MKNGKKILALALALALTLCLCACGGVTRLLPTPPTFEEKLARSAEQMEQAESMHMDLDMDIGLSVTVSGQSQSVDMTARYAVDLRKEPLKMRMAMDISAMGMDQKMIYYAEQADDAVTVYLSLDDGAHWTKQSTSSISDIAPQDLDQQTDLLLACAESFTETGKEEIDGSAATVYTGVISGEYVEEAIKSSGALDTLADALGVEVPEELFRDLGDIPATIAIDDDSSLVVRYSMDMGAVMQSLMAKLMDLALESYGETGAEFELKIDRMLITTTLSQVNSLEEIVIPEAAKAA